MLPHGSQIAYSSNVLSLKPKSISPLAIIPQSCLSGFTISSASSFSSFLAYRVSPIAFQTAHVVLLIYESNDISVELEPHINKLIIP